MFNSYSYSSGGHASASANNYLKINAISGTLVKNHPKSIFVIAKADDTIFDPTNPRCKFPKAEKQKVTKSHQGYNFRPGLGWDTEYYTVEEYVDVEVPCVVLQSMIIGDGLFSCEIVKLSDFYARDPAPKRYSEMTKFLNENGILVVQPVIANEVDAQLADSIDEDVFEEICAKVYETYLQNWDEAPNIWNLVDEELKARGLK